MNYLNRGLIVPILYLIAPALAHSADALPTTHLLPVITESPSGEPLAPEERSTPFLAHLGDISEFDYVEEEYEQSGTGNIYDYVDNAAQSPEVAVSESDIPYVTRLLVRRPADPNDFNGTVYVEIINSTAGWDDDPIWRMSAQSFANVGSAYVGVTSDPITIEFLRDLWGEPPEFVVRNRSRYENLSMDQLGQIWDVLSQTAALLKDDVNAYNPLMDFGVERIILTGYSQSAGFVKTYANSIHNRATEEYGFTLYDAYFPAAGSFGVKKINPPPPGEGDDFLTYGDPRLRVENVPVPVVRFQTETELLAFFAAQTARQVETGEPDGPKIRTYEMAGGVHVDIPLESSGLLLRERDLGFSPEPKECGLPVMPIRTDYIQSALLRATETWVRDGIEPPASSLIELGRNEHNNLITMQDVNENALGGVRSPQIEVPLGRYIANPFTIFDPCFLEGAFIPFTEDRFRELYPTDSFYVQEVDRAISSAVADGFILAEDAESLKDDMLADAGIEDNTGSRSGCTLGNKGNPDHTLPLLLIIALLYQLRRKWLRTHS